MATEGDQPIPATRVSPAAEAAPVAAAPAAEVPVVEKAPAVAEVPAAVVAPAAEEKAPAVELTSEKPSLLETFEKKDEPKNEEAKPEEKAPTAEAKPADGDKKDGEAVKPDAKADKPEANADKDAKDPVNDPAAAEPAKPEPVAYEYALPETLKLDDTRRGEFHSALDGLRADPVKGAQKLVDLHNRAMEDYAASILANQHKAFNDTRSGWQKDVLADEEIGGAGHQTAMRAIARMRDLFVPEKERVAFDQFLRVTGAGDHPQFLKLLHQAARYIDEPSLPPANISPPPNHGKPPGRRRDAIYDHPSSNKRS